MKNGLLAQCRTAGCGWKCCNFGKDGYILLLPFEYESAIVDEKELAHIEVIDENYFGGKKVRCVARDCSVCDKGYKPIMCRTYPYWMRSVSKDILVRSNKCGLKDDNLGLHRDYVKDLFKEHAKRFGKVVDRFLNATLIDNYSVYKAFDKMPLNEEFLDKVCEIEKAGFGEDACIASTKEEVYKCLTSACSCGVVNKGELLAYSLAYYNEYGVGYIEKCFVKEEMRGFGLQKEMVKDNLKKLVSLGKVSDVYAMCSPENKKSLHNFQSVGFKVMRETEFMGQKRLILKWSIYEGADK